MQLQLKGSRIDLESPVVMGVLNVTPDSFSDGGRYLRMEDAVARAAQMRSEGAALIDIGGESTRPGARSVPLDEELRRVVPVVESLAAAGVTGISVDTSKAGVMLAAASTGAALINDVRALREPGAMDAALETGCAVCLVHMRGEPGDMQHAPEYDDVVGEVHAFLEARVEACLRAGMPRERLLVDPGIGFGKRLDHNLSLLKHLDRFLDLGVPVLVGLSRKSLIGTITGRGVAERLPGGLALAALAVEKGARVVRTHDVAETVDALRAAVAVAAAS